MVASALCSAGVSPAVEAASRRLIWTNHATCCSDGFHLPRGGRDANRTAGGTPALPEAM